MSWAISRARAPSRSPANTAAGNALTGENFWARGYYVSTVGLDEAMVRAYIRNQEAEDARYDQMRRVE